MGDKSKFNKIKGAVSPIVSNTEEMHANNFAVPEGILLFNKETRELKVGDGIKNPGEALDHRHLGYSPIAHSHLSSVNEPWLMSNPRLMYRDELVNHPELIPFDGQEVDDATAEYLSRVYPGTKALIDPCKWSVVDSAYGNSVYTLAASSNKEGYTINKITNGPLDYTNLAITTDQWLMDGVGEVSITYSFKGDHQYIIDDYWLMPAAGDSSGAITLRPTPRDWKLEGTTDDSTWFEIDAHSGIEADAWESLQLASYKTSVKTVSNKIRLTISAWNVPDGNTLDAGIRRFWLFGKKPNVFSLPLLEAPSDEFAWVVPKNNLYVGMHHETVGDICYPAQLTEVTALNRICANGDKLAIDGYTELFTVIGHKYDVNPATIVASLCGSNEESESLTYQLALVSPEVACIELKITNTTIDPNALELISTSNQPKHVIIETVAEDGTSTVIAEYPDYSQLDNRTLFQIDDIKTYDMYRHIRVNIISWANEDPVTLNVQITAHDKGTFSLPHIPDNGDLKAYIVTSNVVTDISPEIIQRLQKNHIDLAAVVAELVNRINQLDPEIGG